MKIEQQVCSLELAKRLKELGVHQASYFAWYKDTDDVHRIDRNMPGQRRLYDGIAAFTVAEIGEMLPQAIKANGRHCSEERLYYLTPSAGGNGLRFIDYVAYENGAGTMLAAYPYIEGDTEANARAKMLIYLLEKNLITPHKDTV